MALPSIFPTDLERFALGRVSLGIDPPDQILRGGSYLNVFTEEVLRGDLWIQGRFIAKITTAPCPHDCPVVDVSGKVLIPGFVEGHMHVESSLVEPSQFALAVLRCGVTTVFTDFHEVGAVSGEPGLQEMLQAMSETDVKVLFMTPMQLPFLPEIQHTLSTLTGVEALTLLGQDDTVGLAEVNGADIVKSLRSGRPSDLSLLTHATRNRRTPEGHLFFTRGDDLDACLAVGLSSDHEPRKQDEVVEKVRGGLFVMLRNGTIAREVETLVPIVTKAQLPTSRLGLVTDDMMVTHMTPDTYMLHKVRTAVASGIPIVEALKMVSSNLADHYRVGELVGCLRPGAHADILVLNSLDDLQMEKVFAQGRLVVEHGQPLGTPSAPRTYSPKLLRTVVRPEFTPEELQYLKAGDLRSEVRIRAIELDTVNRFTKLVEVPVSVRGGDVDLSSSNDNLAYLFCANRQDPQRLGLGFLRNYGLTEGGIAVSQAHDHHGIVSLGRTKADALLAANRVRDLQGGVVLVQGGRVTAELPLPVAGLMSDLPLALAEARIHDLEARLRAAGVTWNQPLFFLFWLGMEVAPFFRITDLGLFDTEQQRVLPAIVEADQHA